MVLGQLAPVTAAPRGELANRGFRLAVEHCGDTIHARLNDLILGIAVADGPCLYHAVMGKRNNVTTAERLQNPSITTDGASVIVRGRLLGLDVKQTFTAPEDRPILEERIILANNTGTRVELSDLEIGMQCRVADKEGHVPPELAAIGSPPSLPLSRS